MEEDLTKPGIEISQKFYESYHADKKDLEQQATHLYELAELYSRRAHKKCQWLPGVKSPQPNWTNYIRAHSLYNSAAARDSRLESDCDSAIIDLEKRYFTQECSLSSEQLEPYFDGDGRGSLIMDCKKSLNRLRSTLNSDIVQLSGICNSWKLEEPILKESGYHQEFIEKVNDIRECCTKDMIHLTEGIIHKSCDLLGGIGCSFEVVCFGSLARWEMTPYSDLEFMFLHDEDSPVSEVEKLKHLALSVYFIISNMRETNLRYMNVPELSMVADNNGEIHRRAWFIDSLKNGLKIDGLGDNAGNIPTGNGQFGSKDLITTPKRLFKIWHSELTDPQNKVIVGGFSDLLCASIVVYRNFEDSNIMDSFINLLPKDVSDLQPNYFQMKLDIFKKDVEKFSFMPGAQDGGDFIHDVKKDIYRFPSIAMFDIKVLLQTSENRAEDTITYLQRETGLTDQSAFEITLLVSLAYYVRLAAYLTVDSQKDDILSLLPALSETDHEIYHCPANIYATFGMIHIPFREYLLKSLKNGLKTRKEFLVMVEHLDLNCHSSFTRALVYFYSKSWQECFNIFSEVVSEKETGMDILKPGDLYNCLISLYDETTAWIGELMMIDVLQELEYHKPTVEYALDAVKKLMTVVGCQTATMLEVKLCSRISIAFHHQAIYQDAIIYIQRAYERLLEVACHTEADQKSKIVVESECYLNWGNSLARSSNTKQALEKYQHAMNICKENDLMLGTLKCHNSMAALCLRQRQYNEAEKHANEALKLCEEKYGQATVHPETARALQNLASAISQTRSSLDDFDIVRKTFQKALDMYNKLPAIDAKPLHASHLACQSAYTNCLLNINRLNEATAILNRIYQECLEHRIENETTAFIRYNLAMAFISSEEVDKAIEILQVGIAHAIPTQPAYLMMQGNLLQCYVIKSNWSSAKQTYDSVMQSLDGVNSNDKDLIGASMSVFLLAKGTPANLIEPEQFELAIQLILSSPSKINLNFQKRAIKLQLKLAAIFLEAEQYDRAEPLASQARQSSVSLSLPSSTAEAMLVLSLCAKARGDTVTEEQFEKQAIQLIRSNTNIDVDSYLQQEQ